MVGRAASLELEDELREDVVKQLEEMLEIKTQEVSIIQEQLSLLSRGFVKGEQMTDPYGDTGVYTGQVNKEGIAHGKGTMEYDDGRLYEGSWDTGRWHGHGKAVFTNGDSFEGEYAHDQRNGQGCYRWADGRVYTGGFVGDMREGKGHYTWPDGASYDGEFREGQHSGYGVYQFADGSKYSGEWSQGLYEGEGTLEWSDNRVYVGQWKAGQAHGMGKEVNPDGSVRHDGEWSYDRPVRRSVVSRHSVDTGEC